MPLPSSLFPQLSPCSLYPPPSPSVYLPFTQFCLFFLFFSPVIPLSSFSFTSCVLPITLLPELPLPPSPFLQFPLGSLAPFPYPLSIKPLPKFTYYLFVPCYLRFTSCLLPIIPLLKFAPFSLSLTPTTFLILAPSSFTSCLFPFYINPPLPPSPFPQFSPCSLSLFLLYLLPSTPLPKFTSSSLSLSPFTSLLSVPLLPFIQIHLFPPLPFPNSLFTLYPPPPLYLLPITPLPKFSSSLYLRKLAEICPHPLRSGVEALILV